MDKETFDKAGIPEAWQDDCYISNDGAIFTPQFDVTGVVTKTGQQAYNEWVIAKEDSDSSQLSITDILGQQIAALTLEVAILKGGVA